MENTSFKVFIEEKDQNYGKLYLEPLERGYGDTLGNALRRLLLSSIRGAAVVAVRIDGILHEFSTIPGVREDVIEILMNLKHIPIKVKNVHNGLENGAFKVLTLDSDELQRDRNLFNREENPGVITAKDLPWDSDFEFCGDGILCSLEPNAHLLMEIYVAQGVGYLSAERERPAQPQLPVDSLLTDAIFSPVKRVNYQIEPARVGQSIDYERLLIEVWTNGAVSPEEAVGEASKIAETYFAKIANTVKTAPIKPPKSIDGWEPKLAPDPFLTHPVHDLELSIRSENCLLGGGIKTIGDLLSRSHDDLLKVRNLGRKSLVEIEERIKNLGYALSPVNSMPDTPDYEYPDEGFTDDIFGDEEGNEPNEPIIEEPAPEPESETAPKPEKPKRPSRAKKPKAEAKPEEPKQEEVKVEEPVAQAPAQVPEEPKAEEPAPKPEKPKRPSRAKKPKADAPQAQTAATETNTNNNENEQEVQS